MRPAAGPDQAASGDANLSSENLFLTRLRLELAWFTGRPWLSGRATGGAGVILRFERVRPRRAARFQPLRSHEITPEFLDRTIRALKRWKFDIVSLDEVCHRAVTSPTPRRFVSLTFDGGYKDMITSAYPVLSRHGVPFTVYLPTAFPDRARRGLVARAGGNHRAREQDQPGDGPPRAALRDRSQRRKISALRISRGLDARALAAGSVGRDQ